MACAQHHWCSCPGHRSSLDALAPDGSPARNCASLSDRPPAELHPKVPESGYSLRFLKFFSRPPAYPAGNSGGPGNAVIFWVCEGGRRSSPFLPRQPPGAQKYVSGTMLPNMSYSLGKGSPGAHRENDKGTVPKLAPASRQFFTSRNPHHAIAHLQAKAVCRVLPR